MIDRLGARYRFALMLALLFMSQLIIISTIFLSIGMDLEPAQRGPFGQMLAQRSGQFATLGLLLLLVLGFGLKAVFERYLDPLARLAEDTVLLGANPSHRAAPQGAPEIRTLIEKINALAAAHQALHDDVQAKIDRANRALAEEKDRLAALMSELAQSVLVCNVDGRILLYNTSAKQLLQGSHRGESGAGATTVGLGRSVFGILDRGLIVHALEQIQHQLRHSRDEMARPQSSFVATLAERQMVRVHMVPILDSTHAINGFVLTLEDITRNVAAESRRDALLQSLTLDSRATLANIRAAVEATQTFPDMSAAKRAQFAAIIDHESQRLARQLDHALQHHAEDMDSWPLEEIRGADLIALLCRRLEIQLLSACADGTIDATLWLKVDSYALTQALVQLAQQLCNERGVRKLHLGLERAERLAHLDLSWADAPVAAETLRRWENAATQIGARGTATSLSAVIAHHGGAAVYRYDPTRGASCYRLLLPITEPQAALDIPLRLQGRPEFYDFDLFRRPGQNAELDQRLLPQLTYTVFDTETTGLEPAAGDEIISIGALRIVNGRLLQQDSFDQLVQPVRALNTESIAIHGISDAMLEGQPTIEKVLPQFHRFAEDTVLVAHNAAFDMRFLQLQEERTGISFAQPVLDTLLLSQVIHPHQQEHSLEAIAMRLGVAIVGRHTALGDAIVTGEVFLRMIPLLAEKGIFTLKDARDAEQQTPYAQLHY